MGECFSYLMSHRMIDAAPSASKANVTFSTMLYTLNTPFLFANMDGSEQDVFSISHEFGHCFAMWQQLKTGSHSEGRSMDVCEIHSQAMQLLIFPYYEIFLRRPGAGCPPVRCLHDGSRNFDSGIKR